MGKKLVKPTGNSCGKTHLENFNSICKGRNNRKLLTINVVGAELKPLAKSSLHPTLSLSPSPSPCLIPLPISVTKCAHKFRVSAQVLNKIRGSFYEAQFYLPHVASFSFSFSFFEFILKLILVLIPHSFAFAFTLAMPMLISNAR